VIRINIFTKGLITANSSSFLIPIIKNIKILSDLNISIKFFKKLCSDTLDCDFLLLDSRLLRNGWGSNQIEETKNFLLHIKSRVNKLVFVDLSDSSSFIINDALEICDIYLKNQIYKNKENYLKPYYGRRIFSDYYHKFFKINDDSLDNKNYVKKKKNLEKIKVSWNSCFANYGYFGDVLIKIYNTVPLNFLLSFPPQKKISVKKKNIDLNCRMSTNYSKNTVSFQRRKIKEMLEKKYDFSKISKRKYYDELIRTKIIISPFGYGEINLKDFEAFLNGCILVKPDMAHLDTWPNFYIKNKTYLSFKWDFSDLLEKLENILLNYEEFIDVAMNAREFYFNCLYDFGFKEEFCLRFKRLFCD